MKPRRVQVSHQRDEGFILTVEEYSRFYSFLASVGDKFCALTGHRWCNAGVVGWSMDQDWKHSSDLVRVPIDRKIADKLAYHDDTWSWLDD